MMLKDENKTTCLELLYLNADRNDLVYTNPISSVDNVRLEYSWDQLNSGF